jgi:hypothetical protein
MNKRTRTAVIGGVLIAAMLLMGAGFPTKKVTPAKFAHGVCTSLSDWSNAAQDGATELNTSLTNSATKLSDVRDLLASYLGDTAHLTQVALDGLSAAGTPSTPKGAEASKVLTDSFRKIRTALRKLQNEADDVSIKNKTKALKDLKALQKEVGTELSSAGKALTKLKHLDPNHKLEKAFKAAPACQSL